MIRTLPRLFIPATVLFAAVMMKAVHAEETTVPVADDGQFIVQLPVIDRASLIEQVTALRSRLIERKQALAQTVEDKKLDGGDALITAIMPGGLLYAGIKKARYEQARNELDRVSADIETLSIDLQAVQSRTAPTVVAQAE